MKNWISIIAKIKDFNFWEKVKILNVLAQRICSRIKIRFIWASLDRGALRQRPTKAIAFLPAPARALRNLCRVCETGGEDAAASHE